MGIGSDQVDQKEEKAEPIGSDQAGQTGDGCVHWIGSGGADSRGLSLSDQVSQDQKEKGLSLSDRSNQRAVSMK